MVEELCRMLGAGASDEAARQHARDLLGRRVSTSPPPRSNRFRRDSR